MSNIRNILNKVWGSDKPFVYRFSTWIFALTIWQIVEPNSFVKNKYNNWKLENAISKTQNALSTNVKVSDKAKHNNELNKLKES